MFVSCTKEDIKVTGVTLSDEKSLTLSVGDEVTLKATIAPSDAKDNSVKWESSDNDVATVDNNGNVKAVSVGKATITVRTNDGGFTDQCKITVELKMEDNFDVEIVAGLYWNGNPYTGDLVADPTTFPDSLNSYPYTNSTMGTTTGVVCMHFYVKNTSGKVIPAGTAYKFKLKRNGNVVNEAMELEGGYVVPKPILTEGTTTKNIEMNETYLLHKEEPFYYNGKIEHFGKNEFIVELTQFGKNNYPSSKTKSFDYNIVTK
jgi:hypothetical protein